MTRHLGALALLLVLAAAAPAAELTYPVYRAATPPVLDGEVSGDPAWQTAPASTGFCVLGKSYANAKQTTARLLWGDGAVYLGVVCEEQDAPLMKLAVRDYGETWLEDSLEIFLVPAGQAFQIGVTAGGAKGSGEGGPEVSKVTARTLIGKDFYSVEVCIPAAVVKAAPKAGDKWRGEVCRNIWTTASGGDKFTSWTPLQSRFLEPEHFALLSFMPGSLQPAEAEKLTEQLNAPYRAQLAAQVQAAAALGTQYLPALRQAQTDATYGEQARRLLRDWRRLERLSKQNTQASILDTRQALMKLEALGEQSYQLKYKYLIDQLLATE